MASVQIPDVLPEDVWRPPPSLTLQQEEWRAFGVLCPLVLNHLLRQQEPVIVSSLASQVALCSKTYASLRLTEEARCGVILAVVLTYLETAGLVEIKPSFLARSANTQPDAMESFVSAGPKLKTQDGLSTYRALTLPFMACAVGEVTPGISRALFEPARPSR